MGHTVRPSRGGVRAESLLFSQPDAGDKGIDPCGVKCHFSKKAPARRPQDKLECCFLTMLGTQQIAAIGRSYSQSEPRWRKCLILGPLTHTTGAVSTKNQTL